NSLKFFHGTGTARHRRNFDAAARHGTDFFFIAVPRHIFCFLVVFSRKYSLEEFFGVPYRVPVLCPSRARRPGVRYIYSRKNRSLVQRANSKISSTADLSAPWTSPVRVFKSIWRGRTLWTASRWRRYPARPPSPKTWAALLVVALAGVERHVERRWWWKWAKNKY
ncbi:unnamed protein product, partial [Oikopleura dioica]